MSDIIELNTPHKVFAYEELNIHLKYASVEYA